MYQDKRDNMPACQPGYLILTKLYELLLHCHIAALH